MLSETNRFSLVASFYGPGNIISWLCTVASLLVTWCLHAEHRRKDTITTDLIFALAVPGVAAGHVITIMFSLVPGEPTQTIKQLFTASDADLVQLAAAAEAALNVCETFSMIAVALVFISMLQGHLKRTLAVVAVGFFAFSTEVVVFVQTEGRFGVAASNLSRPFLFNFFEVMICIVAFLVLWTCVYAGMMAWLSLARWKQRREVAAIEQRLRRDADAAVRSLGPPERELGARADPESLANVYRAARAVRKNDLRRWLTRQDEFMAYTTLMSSVVFLPLSSFTSISGAIGIFGSTDYMASMSWTARLSFFIPKSTTRITELDQMFALCVGLIALLYSLFYAFRSWGMEEETNKVEARRQLTETFALSLLQLLDEQLSQSTDETEKQAILERRNQLVEGMSGMVCG